MESWIKPELKPVLLVIAASVSLHAGSAVVSRAANAQAGQQPAAQTPAAARPVGTIKSISGNTITLTNEARSHHSRAKRLEGRHSHSTG